jgi:hypothetical protein
MGALIAAAEEVKESGRFDFVDAALTTAELNQYMQP